MGGAGQTQAHEEGDEDEEDGEDGDGAVELLVHGQFVRLLELREDSVPGEDQNKERGGEDLMVEVSAR
jgi:hypothetical protein